MDFNHRLACAELRSNLFVEPAGNYECKHVELARRQRCEPLMHLFALRALEPLLGGARESLLEGAQEIFVAEGFGQIIDRAGFHRLYTSLHAGAARNENDL